MRALSQADLHKLQQDTFTFFTKEQNPANGLIPDNTRMDSPCSITAVGLALACYVVGVERGFITRQEAIQRVLTILTFFWESPQGMEADATGYKGFYYFLDAIAGASPSYAKILVDSNSKILGAHLYASGADNTIHIFAMAMRYGLTTRDLAQMVYVYPSYTSAFGTLVSKLS